MSIGAKLNSMKSATAPAGRTDVQTIFASADGILLAYGKTVPSDATAGYAPSCIFFHVDGANAGDLVYVNEGTAASCDFDSTHS